MVKKDLNFERDWGHLSKKEQRVVKVLLILKTFALNFMLFASGTIYAFIKCALGSYD